MNGDYDLYRERLLDIHHDRDDHDVLYDLETGDKFHYTSRPVFKCKRCGNEGHDESCSFCGHTRVMV